jgi:hypothetical protein
MHYSQCPGRGVPIAGGVLLAYNGKIGVYSQYFPSRFVVLAGKVGERMIMLCQIQS